MSRRAILSNRLNIGVALVVVFLLVFATNRIDKRHFETVQDVLVTVYNDRIVAQDIVYKMNNIMHERQLLLLDSNVVGNQNKLNTEFDALIEMFATTKLTPKEAKTLESLKRNYDSLKQNLSKNENKDQEALLIENIAVIKIDLNSLSKTQLTESKYKIGVAQKSLNTNNHISTLEIVFLVIIGVVVQLGLFSKLRKL